MTKEKKVLIIGKVWPEPNSSAAGIRMMQLIHYFIDNAYEVTFLSHANQTEFQENLSKLPITFDFVEVNSSKFDALIQKLNPQIVIFDRFMTEEQFSWRVMDHCPNALRILNTEDLHFLREARQQAVKSGIELDLSSYRSDLLLRELAAIHRSDVSLMVSDFEVELLMENYGILKEKLLHLPLYYESLDNSPLTYSEREDFVFIGNFRHEPNLDAVRYLKSTLWPLIKKRVPQAKMNIYGAYCSDKVYQLTNKEDRFIVHGRATNANEVVMKSRVSLAPVRFGAGIKGKLLESMAVGTPSVTTTIGTEGIAEKNAWPGMVTDNPKKFAEAAAELYLNKQVWSESQKKGDEILEKNFTQEHFSAKLTDLFNQSSDLESQRKKSITGLILQRESHQASRYMSIWIEEKKRNGRGGS